MQINRKFSRKMRSLTDTVKIYYFLYWTSSRRNSFVDCGNKRKNFKSSNYRPWQCNQDSRGFTSVIFSLSRIKIKVLIIPELLKFSNCFFCKFSQRRRRTRREKIMQRFIKWVFNRKFASAEVESFSHSPRKASSQKQFLLWLFFLIFISIFVDVHVVVRCWVVRTSLTVQRRR